MNQKFQQIKQFLLKDLWRLTDAESANLPPFREFMYKNLKWVVLAIERFISDKMMNRASALTYTTLLALVPVLAIVFAIARGFGFAKLVEEWVRESFQGHDEILDVLFDSVNSYLSHTQSGIFLGIGFIFLIYTVVNMTSTIENTFNKIWQGSSRTPFRMFTDYFSVLFLVPMVWVVISGFTLFISTWAKNLDDWLVLSYTVRFLIKLIPFLFIGLSFTALYIFMPNTHVKFKCAIIPGFLAGAAFVGVQYFYINSQIWISKYNAIYGSFAALPMFLIWAQTSWTICLFGAELSYAIQNVDAYNFDYDVQHASRRHQDFVTLLLLSTICKRFQTKGLKGYTANELSQELSLPLRMVKNQLALLVEYKWLACNEKVDEDDTYLPATDLQQINVTDVLSQIYNTGKGDLKIDHKKYDPQIQKFRKAVLMFGEGTKDLLLKDF